MVIVYFAGVSGCIAASLGLVVFYFGASMPGATISVLAIIILFFAFKISPFVCMAVLAAGGLYFGHLIEFVLLFAVLACLISLVYYGLYWTAAFVVQVVSLRLVLWKFPFAKRVSTASAIFWLSHGAFEASMLASVLYTVAWCVISFFLAIGFRVIASLDSKIAGDDSGPRKIFVTKAQMKAAKAEMAREAKADAKAAPKGKKKKK